MENLPPPSVELIVLAAVIRAVDREQPGFGDRVQSQLENEAIRAEVIRLRGPRLEPEMRDKFAMAARWASSVRRTTAAAASGTVKRRWFRPPW